MTDALPTAAPLRQPKGLYLLFNVEMWERFSFYGMRAFLVLFLVNKMGGFGWTKAEASHLYAWYTGLVYLTPLLGGYLADRVLGTHRALLVGSAFIASGHFCLAFPSHTTFFLGLSLIILGTGFHKSNIATMVGQLFEQGDSRRDAAFTLFYMGINTGALFGPIICGGLAKSPRFGWHWGFAAAGVGMVFGSLLYVSLKRRLLGTIGDVPPGRRRVGDHLAANEPLSRDEVDCTVAIGIMAFFNIFFWSAFEQAGSSMNFFAEERTNRWVLGWEVPAPFFQSINAGAIILFAPVFASLWVWLGKRNRDPSPPIKFAWGLVSVALGFAVMVAAAHFSDGGMKVSPLWLVAAYVLHTWGELCLSPVGLSMVTKLAPVKFASLLMGLWYCSFFLSDLSAGMMAGAVEKIEKGALFHLLGGQADFFLIFVIIPVAAALVLWALSGRVKRLMHGRA